MDQHFGLDLPENVGTYRIIGIVRDAKIAGFELSKPARPMFYVPLAQGVDYKDALMAGWSSAHHYNPGDYVGHKYTAGTLEPLLTRILAEVDPNVTITSIRTLQQQVELSFDQERAVASLAGLFGVVALCWRPWGFTAYGVYRESTNQRNRCAYGAGR